MGFLPTVVVRAEELVRRRWMPSLGSRRCNLPVGGHYPHVSAPWRGGFRFGGLPPFFFASPLSPLQCLLCQRLGRHWRREKGVRAALPFVLRSGSFRFSEKVSQSVISFVDLKIEWQCCRIAIVLKLHQVWCCGLVRQLRILGTASAPGI